MLKNIKTAQDTTNALLSLLTTSGTLAGISIGLVGVVNLKQGGGVETFIVIPARAGIQQLIRFHVTGFRDFTTLRPD